MDTIKCFDPGYALFAHLPEGNFEGVVTTDVLEHCPKEDVPWIVDEIFGFATEFVYANIACYPAQKTLPNGENAHCTIENPEWWKNILDARVKKSPGLRYFAAYDVIREDKGGAKSMVTIRDSGKWNGT